MCSLPQVLGDSLSVYTLPFNSCPYLKLITLRFSPPPVHTHTLSPSFPLCPLFPFLIPSPPSLSLSQLGSRLVLTILHLHRHVSRPHPHTRGRDPDLGNLLGDLFDLVCRSGSTRLKAGTELSSLAAHDPQREAGDSTRDSRKRHKFETNLEDMRNVCA